MKCPKCLGAGFVRGQGFCTCVWAKALWRRLIPLVFQGPNGEGPLYRGRTATWTVEDVFAGRVPLEVPPRNILV